MAMVEKLQVTITDWDTDRAAMSAVRRAVVIEEQQVPEEIELDANDVNCSHVLGSLNGIPVACGRLVPDGHVGRVAVLREHRGKGYGCAIMQALIALAKSKGFDHVVLSSQVHALPFYEQLGFVARGDEFMEAGIPHQDMVLPLAAD